jgi:hypothetical protein
MPAPHTQQGVFALAIVAPKPGAIVSRMRRRLQLFRALAVAAGLGAAGCAPMSLEAIRADVQAGQGHLIPGVPFLPQSEYQCGPAALAMVLRFHGLDADPEAIARELYLPSVRGTLNLELEFHARRRGLTARAFAGTLEAAKAELRRGRPLIVFQDLGRPPLWSVPHFAVLVGYDDRAGAVVLHSGTTPHRVLDYAAFERTWAARGHWTLLIAPPGAA